MDLVTEDEYPENRAAGKGTVAWPSALPLRGNASTHQEFKQRMLSPSITHVILRVALVTARSKSSRALVSSPKQTWTRARLKYRDASATPPFGVLSLERSVRGASAREKLMAAEKSYWR